MSDSYTDYCEMLEEQEARQKEASIKLELMKGGASTQLDTLKKKLEQVLAELKLAKIELAQANYGLVSDKLSTTIYLVDRCVGMAGVIQSS